MKKLWSFFSSVWLTIALAAVISLVAVWGSVLAVKNPQFYRALDSEILFPWLAAVGPRHLPLTHWIYALVFLSFLFAVNTAVCTADRLYAIIRNRRPWQSFFPHIVHIGFLVAMLGHLAGSVWGFRSYGNVLVMGEWTAVPYTKGLEVRLDKLGVKHSAAGDVVEIRTSVTVKDGESVVKKGDIMINGPLFHDGIAFYHLDHGMTTTGLLLSVDGVSTEAAFNAPFGPEASPLTFGRLYPDYAQGPGGRPVSRSGEFRNPHIEVISSGGGETAILDLTRPGTEAVAGGVRIRLVDFVTKEYAILSINKDPGIWLIIAGSSILVAGMVLLLFMRGGRGEIVRAGSTPRAEKNRQRGI